MSEYVMDYSGWAEGIPIDEYLKLRDLMHARMREEIVRCRDCKDYRANDATCHSWQWHNLDAAIEIEPHGFCAWGERK